VDFRSRGCINAPVTIGTLNEGPLHQALKALYLEPGAASEVPLGGFVADVVAPQGTLFEIQTGQFGPLRRKLGKLVEDHRVVLVHPIAERRHIVRLSGSGEDPAEPVRELSRRRSPKRGAVIDVAARLVHLPGLLDHPNFELEVVLTAEEEYRVHEGGRHWRRRGWRTVERRLVEVLRRQRLRATADLLALLETELPEPFSTAELALAAGRDRALAQKLAYCLRQAGVAEICGKAGNSLLYRLAPGAAS